MKNAILRTSIIKGKGLLAVAYEDKTGRYLAEILLWHKHFDAHMLKDNIKTDFRNSKDPLDWVHGVILLAAAMGAVVQVRLNFDTARYLEKENICETEAETTEEAEPICDPGESPESWCSQDERTGAC